MRGPLSARAPRSFDELADATSLRDAISATLAARPINEDALRCAVWTFVGSERRADTSPDHVILVLTELIDGAHIGTMQIRQALTRRVVLWCVEAYFGHLGGTAAWQPGAVSDDATNSESSR